jgi:hypothetical protein
VSKYLTKIVGAENIKLQVTEEDASTAGNKEAKSDLKVDGKAVLKEALEGKSNNSIKVLIILIVYICPVQIYPILQQILLHLYGYF